MDLVIDLTEKGAQRRQRRRRRRKARRRSNRREAFCFQKLMMVCFDGGRGSESCVVVWRRGCKDEKDTPYQTLAQWSQTADMIPGQCNGCSAVVQRVTCLLESQVSFSASDCSPNSTPPHYGRELRASSDHFSLRRSVIEDCIIRNRRA